MQANKRIVTSMPLTELWDSAGVVQASKERFVSREDVKSLLRLGPIRFVVANVGDKLEWIDTADCFSFWKLEVNEHLYDERRLYLEDYPGEYFYFAYEWLIAAGEKVLLLEKQH